MVEPPFKEGRSPRLSLRVGDISEQELGRMMVDLIPAAPWQKKLIEEDDKKRQGLALIIKGLPQAATSEDVSAMVEETTKPPSSLW